MPLIYVTGAPGSGKSTVLRELQDRGCRAFGTDEHDYSHWINRQSGKIAVPPENFDVHTWYKEYEWALNPRAVAELRRATDTASETTYLFGVAAGLEAVQHYFNLMIVLTANTDILKQRVLERKDSSFGKTPEELKIILDWQKNHVDSYKEQGATIIDTSRISPSEVAESILELSQSLL